MNASLRTVAEVAAQLRLSTRAVYELCQSGDLQHFRFGRGRGAIRVSQSAVEAYVHAQMIKNDCTTSDS